MAASAPSASSLRVRRARCLLATGDHAGVLDDTRRVLAGDDSNVQALELRGHAFAAMGEDEAASQVGVGTCVCARELTASNTALQPVQSIRS
jgi:hypothetical protein